MNVTATRSPLALLGAATLALPAIMAVTGLRKSPDRNVPDWLHVSAADIALCTQQVQVMVAASIVICGAAGIAMAVLHRLRDAALALAVLAYLVATAVFAIPNASLGWRDAYPRLNYPGQPLNPIPISTDFDFRAYLPDLMACITTPALWAAIACLPLGLIVAASVGLNHRRRCAPATV